MKPHRARVLAMQAIFQQEFQKRPRAELYSFDWIDYRPPQDELRMAKEIIEATLDNLDEIDNEIKKFSINWDITRISHLSKAILRISMAQLRMNRFPPKVIIDEGIKLAKVYAEDDSGRFINGILDAFWQQNRMEETSQINKANAKNG